MSSIFISHASKDDILCGVVEKFLKANGFDDYFVDHESIRIGDKWAQALRNAARSCRVVICLVTENWISSGDCYGEFMAAYYMGRRIFPLFFLKERASQSADALSRLRRVQSEDQGYDLSACDPGDAEATLPPDLREKLIVALRAAGAIGEVGLDPAAFSVDMEARPSPFPGLQSFEDTDADAAIFYGRSPDIARCLEDIRRMRAAGEKRIFALIGASGSGKSSLLKAGVLPRMRREKGWIVLRSFTPTSDPLLELSNALVGMANVAHGMSPGSVRDELLAGWRVSRASEEASPEVVALNLAKSLLKIVSKLYVVEEERDITLLVTVDQAEQLLRLRSEENVAFCGYLEALVLFADQAVLAGSSMPRRYMVAMTLRSDNLDEFQSSTLFAGLRLRAADIRPVNSFRLAETIEVPAKRYGVSLDVDLLDIILQNIPEKDPLPLVAFMLERMWRLYRQDNRLPASAYDAMGGLDRLLAVSAERALAGLDPDDQSKSANEVEQRVDVAAARAFVPPLAQVDSQGVTIRRTAMWSAFSDEARGILERFVAWRLVTIRQSASEAAVNRNTVEVAHEALFRSWPRLATWIGNEKRLLQELRDLQDAAMDWNREGRRSDYCVHQEQRLRNGQALLDLAHFAAQLSPLDKEYMAACVRRRLGRRIRAAMLAMAAALALIVTTVAFDTLSSKQKLSLAASQLVRDGHPAKAAKFGVAGAFDESDLLKHASNDGGSNALRETGFSFPVMLSLPGDGVAAAWKLLGSGKRLIVSSDNDAGGVWDVDAKKLLIDLHSEGAIKDFFLADENWLFSRGGDDSMSVWDLASGLRIFATPSKSMNSANWNSASKRLATLSEDGVCVLWDFTIGLKIDTVGVADGTEACDVMSLAGESRVVTRSTAGVVEIWDGADARKISTIPLTEASAAISRIQKNLIFLVTSMSGRASLYDAHSGQLIAELPTARILGTGFSSDGEKLITRAIGNSVDLWNTRTGELMARLGNASGNHWEFSPDGQQILVRTTGGSATIWDSKAGKPLLNVEGEGLRIFKFADHGNRLAVISYGGAATLWNVDPNLEPEADRKLADLAGPGNDAVYADSVVFSANGKWLALGSDNSRGGLWNAADGKKASLKHLFDSTGEGGGEFSADEQVYASSGYNNDGALYRGDIKVAPLGGPSAVQKVKITGNGGRVATRSSSDALIVWDTSRGIKYDVRPEVLRREVCKQNYDYVGTFTRDELEEPSGPAHEVRRFIVGRPWHPCDWRGLGSSEGWKQLLRYFLVQAGVYRDYVCGETTAFSGRPATARRCASVVSDVAAVDEQSKADTKPVRNSARHE